MPENINRGQSRSSDQLPALQQSAGGARSVSVNRAARVSAPDQNTGRSLVDSLSKAAGIAGNQIGYELEQKRQDDIVRQQNRALLNQQPTDDATQAGYVAHGVVGLQNNAMALTKRLQKDAMTFTGTDEEWTEKVVDARRQLQEETFAKYPALEDEDNRTDMLAAATNIWNEQSLTLTQARVLGKLDQEQKARMNTFSDNLITKTEGLEGAALGESITSLMTTNREALQLTEDEAEGALLQAALTDAASGDGRLVEFAKSYKGGRDSTLFERSAKLQKAEVQYKQRLASENQGYLARTKTDLFDGYLGGELTWRELTDSADKLNEKFGGRAVTDEQLMSLRNRRQGKVSEDTDVSLALDAANNSRFEGYTPAGVKYTDPKLQQKVIAAKEAALEQTAANTLAQIENPTPQQIATVKADAERELALFINSSQFVHEGWASQFEAIPNYNLEGIDAEGDLPAGAAEVIRRWDEMPEGSRLDHTKPKTAAFFSNFETFRSQGMSDVQAMAAAQKASRNPAIIDATTRSSIASEAASLAEDLTEVGFFGITEAPAWYQDRLSLQLNSMIKANMDAGYMDVDKAAEAAKASFETHYTQLGNGQLMFGGREQIASQMNVHPSDIEVTLDTYLDMNKTRIEDELSGVTIDEVYFDVVPNRDIVILRSGVDGLPVQPPIPLSDLKRGRDAWIMQREESADRERDVEGITEDIARGRAGLPATGKGTTLSASDVDSGSYRKDKILKASEMFYEERDAFRGAIKQVENSAKDGWDKRSKVWTPHESLEGGTQTLAYGHKLTAKEAESGTVEVDGVSYSFKEGESQITEQVAEKLMVQDLDKARSHLQLKWRGYEDLPAKYQKLLVSIQYNTGDVTSKSWAKLNKAMKEGDDEKVRQEMVTTYKAKTGKKLELTGRADAIAEALGL